MISYQTTYDIYKFMEFTVPASDYEILSFEFIDAVSGGALVQGDDMYYFWFNEDGLIKGIKINSDAISTLSGFLIKDT